MDDVLTKLNEHFLSCNICTETFKDPCTIGCQHTFCRKCLTKYTKTCREAITAKSILCPNCRQMTKVPRPQEPVDQWCQQFMPSFIMQGLLDTFKTQESSDPVENCCFACQHIGKTTQAKSVCEDCDILFCEACAKIHQVTPVTSGHVISPLGAGSTPRLKKRKVMCKEHNCLVEFCCKDCQEAVCQKCCVIYHRKCDSVVTLESMIPEMKQVLQQNSDQINSHMQQAGIALTNIRSKVEEITRHKSSLQSEIRRISQQAMDLFKRKETKLMDELDTLTEKQTGQLKGQIKSGEIDFQTCQQYTEFIKQLLHSNSPMDLYDIYTLCQSGAITAEIKRNEIQEDQVKKILFKKQLNVNQLDNTFQLGYLKCTELLSTVSTKTKDDKHPSNPTDIEVLNIGIMDILVITDIEKKRVMSCYTKDGESYCTSISVCEEPVRVTKISQDRVAVSFSSHNSIELIKLTPDPVLVSSIKTKKKYRCLTALSDTTLAAGCGPPPSIDVLDLSGRVLRSVITPSIGQHLIQQPWHMCITREGNIVATDGLSGSVWCVTPQGEVVYTYKLRCYGVTTTDTGSVIVADHNGNMIVQLTERGEYVRDLLTEEDGIFRPWGIRVYENKLYVTEDGREHIKIFQL